MADNMPLSSMLYPGQISFFFYFPFPYSFLFYSILFSPFNQGTNQPTILSQSVNQLINQSINHFFLWHVSFREMISWQNDWWCALETQQSSFSQRFWSVIAYGSHSATAQMCREWGTHLRASWMLTRTAPHSWTPPGSPGRSPESWRGSAAPLSAEPRGCTAPMRSSPRSLWSQPPPPSRPGRRFLWPGIVFDMSI